MSQQPKIRIIAGPNGSGKTTFINQIKENKAFNIRNYINADDIQQQLNKHQFIGLENYSLRINKSDFENFVKNSGFSNLIEEQTNKNVFELFDFKENTIYLKSTDKSSYFAALIADFIRINLLETSQSFEYETVMSHISKIDFLKEAKEKGYKVYLYFLCCSSPQINKINVANRVKQGGHFVDDETIEKRYYKTLNNLFGAIVNANMAYVFENTLNSFEQVSIIQNNQIISIAETKPTWFTKYYLEKIKH